MGGWMNGWLYEIKTCLEVRESDIINVSNGLPNCCVCDEAKNDFIP